MELQALSGQLYIVDGVELAEQPAPGLLSQPAPPRAGRGRAGDYLFVHLTLSGPPAETETLAQDLLDAVSTVYFETAGSVTAALRKALVTANQLLFDLNMSGAGVNRQGAMIGAALRGRDLYMVQTGESLAMIGRRFGVERLPATQPERITPMGRGAGLDIRFFHNVLEPGDMLLLADPRLAHLSPAALEPALVDRDVEEGLEALKELVGVGTARLLLVEFTDEALDELPEALPISVTRGGAGTDKPLAPPTRAPVRPVAGRARAQPASGRGSAAIPHRSAGPERPGLDLEGSARRATAQTARGLAQATGGLAAVLARLRPPRQPDDEELVGASTWALAGILALVIPIIVAAAVTGVYIQRGVFQRLGNIEDDMRAAMAAAESAGTVAEQRFYYEQVLTLAREADTVNPDDAAIAQLRARSREALDRLDGIDRLVAMPVYQHKTEGTSLTRVALREGLNGGIFALDQTNNLVYFYDTDESYGRLLTAEPETIFFGGQSFGAHIVGTMMDLFWRPAGRNFATDGLAVLDRRVPEASLLNFVPQFKRRNAVSLGLSGNWIRPVATTTYNERLYVLDTGAQVVWRYLPEGEGFVLQEGNQTLTFYDEPNLDRAVDLAIDAADANVVLIYADGGIRFYESRSGRILWDQSDLFAGDIAPLVRPVAVKVVGEGLNASIFVADAGTGRILQLGRPGTVLAQYKATDASGRELFLGLADFDVALQPLRIVAPVGDTLYQASLP